MKPWSGRVAEIDEQEQAERQRMIRGALRFTFPFERARCISAACGATYPNPLPSERPRRHTPCAGQWQSRYFCCHHLSRAEPAVELGSWTAEFLRGGRRSPAGPSVKAHGRGLSGGWSVRPALPRVRKHGRIGARPGDAPLSAQTVLPWPSMTNPPRRRNTASRGYAIARLYPGSGHARSEFLSASQSTIEAQSTGNL
jgi:hypothetical protein